MGQTGADPSGLSIDRSIYLSAVSRCDLLAVFNSNNINYLLNYFLSQEQEVVTDGGRRADGGTAGAGGEVGRHLQVPRGDPKAVTIVLIVFRPAGSSFQSPGTKPVHLCGRLFWFLLLSDVYTLLPPFGLVETPQGQCRS